MDESKIVIAGGGMVAGYAARQLIDLGSKSAELAILSADTSLPYERPPLSKGFLAGRDAEESIRINAESFYREHGIEVRLGCEISAVNSEQKRLLLASGAQFGSDKLIVATGARPRGSTHGSPALAGRRQAQYQAPEIRGWFAVDRDARP